MNINENNSPTQSEKAEDEEEQIIFNPEYLEIQKEMEIEDMRTTEIENNISSENDDY